VVISLVRLVTFVKQFGNRAVILAISLTPNLNTDCGMFWYYSLFILAFSFRQIPFLTGGYENGAFRTEKTPMKYLL